MLDMSSLEELSQTQTIKFSKVNYSIDIGVGIDLYFAYFKFSPEIKYSHGLRNILVNQNNINNDLINGLYSQSILISLTFE